MAVANYCDFHETISFEIDVRFPFLETSISLCVIMKEFPAVLQADTLKNVEDMPQGWIWTKFGVSF